MTATASGAPESTTAEPAVAGAGPPAGAGRPHRQLGRGVLSLWRPEQWPKNVLVVSVPLLDLAEWSLAAVWRIALAVVAFTIASTVVYAVNDIVDRERDRLHPVKRRRAVASGQVSAPVAALCAVAQAALLVGILATQPVAWAAPIVAYLLLSVAYNAKLKHLPILDVFAVAAGFVLRLLQGYVAIGSPVAEWLTICVLCLCLTLILGKRRTELHRHGAAYRPALRGYTVALTDRLIQLSATMTAMAYLFYLRTEAPLGSYAGPATLVSVPFALFGLFRYLQVLEVDQGGENPVRVLLRDRAMVVNAALWLVQALTFLLAARYPEAIQLPLDSAG